jgi:spermidine synthase
VPSTTDTSHARPVRWLLPILAVLFFGSGVSALIYQLLWLRLLGLIFGVTVHAASTVLASFMAGLALGSVLAGRLADRVRRPLVWLAIAEVAIAISSLLTPAAFRGLESLYRAIHTALPSDAGVLALARFVCSFAVLVVPTMMMGATLPLILKSSLLGSHGVGRNASVLYATNTAGAIGGTLLAGFYLIDRFGIAACFRIAAIVNVLVAAGAAYASRALAAETGDSLPRSQGVGDAARSGPDSAFDARTRTLVLVVFALSGFTSLALEVIWFRAIVLFVPATIYAFTTMLATFLGGIAAGSYAAVPLMRQRRDRLSLLASLELGIGIVSLISWTALAGTYALGWRTSGTRPACALAVFPATLLMGMAFPVGLGIYTAGERQHLGERVGRFYAWNTVGAILGAVAAGFVLLPRLGSRMSLATVAAVSVASGLLLLSRLPAERRRFAIGAGVSGALLFAAAVLALADPFAAVLARRYPGENLVWHEEGVQATVSIHAGQDGHSTLYLDGLHQANTSPEMLFVHGQLGHLPMALHPDPRNALVIGLGGGATAAAVSEHDGASVDLVELSGVVVRAAPWFRDANTALLQRPNLRLRIDDGRNYLLLTSKRYDVITADVIQPYHAGAGNVYSAEYFRLGRRALDENGLLLQWIGHQADSHYKLIMRTFLSVFPYTTLWAGGTLMVGSKQPLRLSPADFEAKRRRPATRAALDSMRLHDFDALVALYNAGPDQMRRFVGQGPILTDDRPMLEYHRSLPQNDPQVDLTPLTTLQHRREEIVAD